MPKRTNGEGTIYQRPNGLWCAELTIGYDGDGKRIKKNFSSMDLEKLQKKLNDEKYKVNRGIVTETNSYTVYEWVKFWLENYKRDLKPTTYDTYEYTLECHIKDGVGHYKINKLRPEMLQAFYNQMRDKKLSTSTIRKVHLELNQAFEQAIKNNLLYGNPCKAVTVPKIEPKEAIPLTVDEQAIFVKNCPKTTFGNIFLFALNTGMRCGEIVALTWDDVNFNTKTITVANTAATVKNRERQSEEDNKTKMIINSPKTQKGVRTIPLSNAALVVLQEQRDKPQNKIFVFSSKVGTIFRPRNIVRSFDEYKEKIFLDDAITIHSLRHTFATRLLEKGASAKVVSDLLGHSSIQVTLDTYSHVLPNLKQEVISLLN